MTSRVVIIVVLATGAMLAQEQTPPVFRTTTRLVVQVVNVTDRNGKPIEGLTAKDFTVFEDDTRQDVAFAEFQRLDGSAARLGTPSPPIMTSGDTTIAVGRAGEIRYANRRLLVFYFDLTAMPPFDRGRAFAGATRFIDEGMNPADLVAVLVHRGTGPLVVQDFSDDRARLRDVIGALQSDVESDDSTTTGSAFGQGDTEFNLFNTDRQLTALQNAMAMLRALPERKSLLYFSSGLRLNGSDNQAQIRATANAATGANVTINPIDARGLMAVAPFGDATQSAPTGRALFSGDAAQALMNRLQRSQDTLFALARDTHGRVIFDENDLGRGIARSVQDVSSYYLVGYYSTNLEADGRRRRVRMALAADRSGELSYRDGYYAERPFRSLNAADREMQLQDALRLEDPITDVQMAVEVNYFRMTAAEYFVPVSVKIPGRELSLARGRGAVRTTIDVIGEVKDDRGTTHRNVRDRIDLRLDDTTIAGLGERPIQYDTGFTLLPGSYVIKILARDGTTGRMGTYQTSFRIPNLDRDTRALPTSSVVLSSQRVPLASALFSARGSTTTNNPLVDEGQKLVPSVTRVFSTRRPLFVLLQAYQQDATTMRPLVAFVALYRNGDKIREGPPLPITSGWLSDSRAVPVRLSLSLASVPPGAYECQVTVLDPGRGRAAFSRTSIVVVP